MKTRQNHSIDVVFVLMLLCTFAVSVLMVLMTGASAYEGVTDHMQKNYDDRTGVAYITEKVRHCGDEARISVGELPAVTGDASAPGSTGIRALCISQVLEGERYVTYMYYYDGYMRELFTDEGNALAPDTGTPIIALDSFGFDPVSDGLVRVTCRSTDGTNSYAFIDISGQGGADDEAA